MLSSEFGMGRKARPLLLVAVVLVATCGQDSLFPPLPNDTETRFPKEAKSWTVFGTPNNKTGIADECCMPRCLMEDGTTWTVPPYTNQDLESLYWDWELRERPELPPVGEEEGSEEWFCAVEPLVEEWIPKKEGPLPYNLVNVRLDGGEAETGVLITHREKCGACSSLQNLAVYIAYTDLTVPVRECGIGSILDGTSNRLACIASLGFDLPCARAWEHNTELTQRACLIKCGRGRNLLGTYNRPYACSENEPDPPHWVKSLGVYGMERTCFPTIAPLRFGTRNGG